MARAAPPPHHRRTREQTAGSTRTVSMRMSKSKWTIEAINAAASLHQELGKWPRVVEPFRKLAKANGWCRGLKLTRRSISDSVARYMPLHECLDAKETRKTNARATKQVDSNKAPAPARAQAKLVEQQSKCAKAMNGAAAPADAMQQHLRGASPQDAQADAALTLATHVKAIGLQRVSLESLIDEYDRINSAIACLGGTELMSDEPPMHVDSFIPLERAHAAKDARANLHSRCETTVRARLAHQRDAVVAQIAVLLTPHRAVLEQSPQPLHHYSDNTHLQRASHAKCAVVAVGVDNARANIASLHRVLQCVLNQSDTCDLATVNHLAAVLAAEEQTLRQLEIARLGEFRLLLAHSDTIRRLAQAIHRDQDGSSP